MLGDERQTMLPRKYSHLNDTQTGAFGEAFVRMAFGLAGFEVYASDCDDRGIDFVARMPAAHFYSAQVKTTRPGANPFIIKKKFQPTDQFLFVAVRLIEGKEPQIYLARGSEWNNPNGCLHYNPSGGRAGAYYEVRFAKSYESQLVRFRFHNYVPTLT